MIEDVKCYDSKEYVVDEKNNRIGYKEFHGVTYDIIDGYKTMFLFMQEREKGKINE